MNSITAKSAVQKFIEKRKLTSLEQTLKNTDRIPYCVNGKKKSSQMSLEATEQGGHGAVR